MLSQAQTEEFKRRLLDRQGRIISQLQNHFDLEVSQTDAVGELSSYDNHPGDMATEIYEREKDIALNEHAEKELEEINEALSAINEGTYGICRVCSMDIPYDRLDALPTTDTCVDHTPDQQTFSQPRPVEENVYSPNVNPQEDFPEEEQNIYDAEDAWQDVARYGNSDTPSDFFDDRDNYNLMFLNSHEDIGAVEDIENAPYYDDKDLS